MLSSCPASSPKPLLPSLAVPQLLFFPEGLWYIGSHLESPLPGFFQVSPTPGERALCPPHLCLMVVSWDNSIKAISKPYIDNNTNLLILQLNYLSLAGRAVKWEACDSDILIDFTNLCAAT